jgi:ubiquinone biosynthesis protein COQ4
VDWENEPVPDDVKLFRERMRDAHDLTHILTGYGRDGLGEMCLLAFMNRHSHNLGQLFVIAMNWPRLPKPWRAAIRQAWRNGKKARWFQNLDFEALLPRNLNDVRRELNIPAPTLYQAVTP